MNDEKILHAYICYHINRRRIRYENMYILTNMRYIVCDINDILHIKYIV